MKKLSKEAVSNNEFGGFGKNVVRLRCKETGKVICHIGKIKDKEFVHFDNSMSSDLVIAVAKLLHRKKMKNALDQGKFKKAQEIADQKFKEKEIKI